MRADVASARGVAAGLLALMLLAVAAPFARAQECTGNPSFDAARIRVGAAAERRESESWLAGTVTMGGRRFFGDIVGGIVTYDAFETAGRLVGGTAGAAWMLPHAIQVCPVASAHVVIGPSGISGSDVDASTLDARIGVGLGRSFGVARGLQLVPAARASLRRERLSLDAPTSGESFRRADTFGMVDVAFGIVIVSRVAIVPRVGATIGAIDDGMNIALAISVGLGRGQ